MVSLPNPGSQFRFLLLSGNKQFLFDGEPDTSAAIPGVPERPLLPSSETISQLRKAAFTFTSGRAKP
jgi:hypothetical protein